MYLVPWLFRRDLFRFGGALIQLDGIPKSANEGEQYVQRDCGNGEKFWCVSHNGTTAIAILEQCSSSRDAAELSRRLGNTCVPRRVIAGGIRV